MDNAENPDLNDDAADDEPRIPAPHEPGCYSFLLVQLTFAALFVLLVVLRRFDLPMQWLALPLAIGIGVLLWWRLAGIKRYQAAARPDRAELKSR
jgi:hypothetical protein